MLEMSRQMWRVRCSIILFFILGILSSYFFLAPSSPYIKWECRRGCLSGSITFQVENRNDEVSRIFRFQLGGNTNPTLEIFVLKLIVKVIWTVKGKFLSHSRPGTKKEVAMHNLCPFNLSMLSPFLREWDRTFCSIYIRCMVNWTTVIFPLINTIIMKNLKRLISWSPCSIRFFSEFRSNGGNLIWCGRSKT